MSATSPDTAVSEPRLAAEAIDVDLLRQTPLFRDMDEALLERLLPVCSIASVAADTMVARQGERSDYLLVVLSGQIALMNAAPNGDSAVVEVVHPGGQFFLSTVLSRLPLLMSAQTVCPTRLLRLSVDGVLALLPTEPSLAASLLRAEAMDFRAMVRQVCDLKLRTTAQRLGCYLLALSKDHETNSVALRLPFDKRLLAARLGCRQENLSRAFAALRSVGVETHGARVILHDVARLRDYAVPDEFTDAEFA
jgi:CRP/FNR family transcriptional activator FtrB